MKGKKKKTAESTSQMINFLDFVLVRSRLQHCPVNTMAIDKWPRGVESMHRMLTAVMLSEF